MVALPLSYSCFKRKVKSIEVKQNSIDYLESEKKKEKTFNKC
jgi:hypothetical protein